MLYEVITNRFIPVSKPTMLSEIIGPGETFKEIADRLHAAGVQPDDAGLRMLPKQEIELEVADTVQVV